MQYEIFVFNFHMNTNTYIIIISTDFWLEPINTRAYSKHIVNM